MNILVVCQYYYPEPFRISDICEELVKIGHKVTVLTGLPNYPEGIIHEEYRKGKKRKEILNGVNIIRSFEIGRGNGSVKLFINYLSFMLSASVKVLFLKEKYDVIMVNQLSPVMMAIPAIIYKKIHKKNILLYCLDLWPASLIAGGIRENSIIYKVFFNISKCIYNNVDKILVTSNMFKEYFLDELKLNIDGIEYLPQYAEDLYAENVKICDDEKFNFVFAGNIGEMQNVDTIVKAAEELKEYNDIRFHIIGDGSQLNYCKKLSEKLELENITFYGRKSIEDMPYYYNLADAMLITLRNDKFLSYTLPGKVQSYMAAGKPILGAINGETKLIIERSKCGFCCEAENYKKFANLIFKFCKCESKIQMGNNSKKYYLNNFSKTMFIKKTEKALKDLEDKNNYVQK